MLQKNPDALSFQTVKLNTWNSKFKLSFQSLSYLCFWRCPWSFPWIRPVWSDIDYPKDCLGKLSFYSLLDYFGLQGHLRTVPLCCQYLKRIWSSDVFLKLLKSETSEIVGFFSSWRKLPYALGKYLIYWIPSGF